jgi:putative ABC transport system permease protein
MLMRLVLAEAVLIGIVGCGLGLAAGAELSMDAHQLGVISLGFNPPTNVPWDMVLIGSGIVMGISILASFWPAFSTSRSEPLTLLQAGRASA